MEIRVAYLPDSLPAVALDGRVNYVLMDPDVVCVEGKPSKAAIMRELLKDLGSNPPSHILFTDCDILYPEDFVPDLIDSKASYQVADRIDLTAEETMSFMRLGEIPATGTINPKKRGMGWFQFVRWDALSFVTRQYRWDYKGYDVFDWVLNRDLCVFGDPRILPCSPFVHLWHGDPGSTWKGTDVDL